MGMILFSSHEGTRANWLFNALAVAGFHPLRIGAAELSQATETANNSGIVIICCDGGGEPCPDCAGLLQVLRGSPARPAVPVLALVDTSVPGARESWLGHGATAVLDARADAVLLCLQVESLVRVAAPAAASGDRLLEELPVAFLVIDGEGRLRHVNRAARELFRIPEAAPLPGLPGDVLRCRHLVEAAATCGTLPPCAACIVRGTLETVLRDGPEIVRRFGWFAASGEDGIRELSLSVAGSRADSGAATHALLACQLVGSGDGAGSGACCEACEDELRQNERQLRELNETKDRLFSVLAHDLRNSFHAFLAFSGLLAENLEDYSTAELREIIEPLHSVAANTNMLLENLLKWGRAQQRQLPFDPVRCELLPVVAGAVAAVAGSGKLKNVRLDCRVPPGLAVVADREMLATILRNLLSNAVKFSLLGGRVVVTAEASTDAVTVRVVDNGVGMDAATLQTLFDIGTRKRAKGTGGETGTGFGLSLCQAFVERHGGRLAVESEPGRGSVFSFTLPLPSASVPA